MSDKSRMSFYRLVTVVGGAVALMALISLGRHTSLEAQERRSYPTYLRRQQLEFYHIPEYELVCVTYVGRVSCVRLVP